MRRDRPSFMKCPECGEIVRAHKDEAGRYQCKRCGARIKHKPFNPNNYATPKAGRK